MANSIDIIEPDVRASSFFVDGLPPLLLYALPAQRISIHID